ncbi:hypothetical protein HT576_03715 [Haloterrigena sp. SYSU A121-1]|uniref:Uncharacterized protein n=1 Tax=Haloterrigena gelatinilytica TaxID=2741724 RepID=A0A8J8GKT3_9EURY|nr:hypothetical protein [Haloterrigena gelatinilytica]NUB90142.1 hypothetical protein [Haloterrigena gelatinilytica]
MSNDHTIRSRSGGVIRRRSTKNSIRRRTEPERRGGRLDRLEITAGKLQYPIMPPHELVERHVDSLGESVSAVRDASVEDLDPFDRHALRADFLLDEIPSETVESDTINRYERLSTETQSVLDTAEYREKARSELRTRIDHFPKTVCYFHELDPVPNEVELAVNRRDAIEMYLDKLADYYDLSEQQIRIDTLDDVFRCRYEMYIDDVQEYVVELPYYPDSYWWRHPSAVAAELE